VTRIFSFFRKMTGLGSSGEALPIAAALLCFPVLMAVLGALGLVVGVPVSVVPALVGLVGSGLYAWWLGRRAGCPGRVLGWVGAILLAVLFFGAAKLADAEWDGKTIHKPAVIFLAAGWNPLQQIDPDGLGRGFDVPDEEFAGPWCVYYPKAHWIASASLYRLTGNVDAGDALGLLFMAVLFWTALACLPRLYGLSPRGNVLLSLALACNPVAVRELTCGYVDGLLGLMLVTTVLALAAYAHTRETALLALAVGCCVYGVNLKFTGAVYFGVALVAVSVPYVWRQVRAKQLDRRWMLAGLLAAALSLACGLSPYLVNIAVYGTPFYPLHSFDKSRQVEDVIKQWQTSDAAVLGRAGLFVYAQVSGGEQLLRAVSQARRGSPFSPFSRTDLCAESSEAFKLAFTVALVAVVLRRRIDPVLAALLLSIAVQPQAWHARYVPQLWAVPALACCALGASLDGRILRRVCAVLLAVALWHPAGEMVGQMIDMARWSCGLPAVAGERRGVYYTYTNAPTMPRQYALYWRTFMRDFDIGPFDPIDRLPEEREAALRVFDLRLYTAAPVDSRPQTVCRGLVALLRARVDQFRRARWFDPPPVLPRERFAPPRPTCPENREP